MLGLALVHPSRAADADAATLPSAKEAPQEIDMGLYLQGRAIFEQQCAPCHGRTGRGNGDWATGVPDKPRNFRKGIFKFRSTPGGYLPTTADLERTLRGGISGTMMPAFTQLPDHDVKSVLAYVRSFSSRWKDPANYHAPVALPSLPDWFGDPAQRAERARSAAPLFQTACAACHGTTGAGDGPAAGTLMDVWEQPVKPANFTQPHRKSGATPEDLYRSLALGLDGTPMTGYQHLLPPETLWALVAHILSLSEAGEKATAKR
jgi:mono/diheme cytochrome c family protein